MTKYVLSVDPGKATGIVMMSWDGISDVPRVLLSKEVQPDEFAGVVEVLLNTYRNDPNLTVVCERFTINAQTVRNSQAPYSLEQIGVLKHLCRTNMYDPDKIVFQSPADAKNMFPNPVLKKLETWHVGGEGHANDAMRHALLRLVKTGWIPRTLLN
jgi:hypothetical protein